MFITFEGIDGSGKTTQIQAAAALLRDRGYDVLLTREPGGTAIGDQIRSILLENKQNTNMVPQAELLLFCASRAQLIAEVVRPWLVRPDGIVISDRYADSTLAYQGYGHGLDIDLLRQILSFATGGLTPDLTVYLDLQPEVGLQRRRKGQMLLGEEWNRLDDMALQFHERVYAGYEALIKAEAGRWARVNADRESALIQADIRELLLKHLPQEAH